MPKGYDIKLFIIQIFIIVLLAVITIFLLRLNKSLQYEKRLGKYGIDSIKNDSPAFFDLVNNFFIKIRSILTKVLKKLKIFNSYSLKYEKYIDGSKKIREEAMDYISMKLLTSIATIIVVVLSDVLQYQSITLFQIFYAFLIGFFIPDLFLIAKNKYIKRQIENDLLKAIIIMNNAFKSGRSTMQAIKIVSEELTGPISDEFKKMYIDLTFGLSLEVVFSRFSKRVNLDEVKYITTSLTILNQTGGNIVKVFSSIEQSFFNRRKLKHELKTLTASADAIFKILIAIPFLMSLVIIILNPTYFVPLFDNLLGISIFLIIVILYVGYILIVRRVMKIKE